MVDIDDEFKTQRPPSCFKGHNKSVCRRCENRW